MKCLKLTWVAIYICVCVYSVAQAQQTRQTLTEAADAQSASDSLLKLKDYVSPDSPAVTSGIDDTEWLFGEVLSVDALLKKFNVKYLDYVTNAEKEMLVYVGENTLFDGVSSLEEIKEKDSVSLNYKMDAQENRCIASTLSVVKDPGNETIPLPDMLSNENNITAAEKDLADVKNLPAAEQPRQ